MKSNIQNMVIFEKKDEAQYMKKMIKVFIGGILALIITGCAQPGFNPARQQIVFVEGVPFRIPVGASATPKRYRNNPIDNERLSVYKSYGLNCNYGDILWMENYTANQAVKTYKSNGKLAGYAYVGQAHSQGRSGCVRPLTPQEFEYYKMKELDESANRRAYANYMAATAPRTVDVNVNHSGYVNHNISGTMNYNIYNYRY